VGNLTASLHIELMFGFIFTWEGLVDHQKQSTPFPPGHTRKEETCSTDHIKMEIN